MKANAYLKFPTLPNIPLDIISLSRNFANYEQHMAGSASYLSQCISRTQLIEPPTLAFNSLIMHFPPFNFMRCERTRFCVDLEDVHGDYFTMI